MTQTEKLIRIKLQKKDYIVSLLLKTKLIFGEKITSQNIISTLKLQFFSKRHVPSPVQIWFK